MKRKTALIVALLTAVCLCTGIVFAQTIKPELSFKDLSDEDIAVKAKIAEASNTKVDFRYNKQEKIQEKTYDVSFVELNSNVSAVRKVIYQNDVGDEFKYDIETGKLLEADIDSNIVAKTTDSIDIETAHKIALEHLPKNCNIREYTQLAYDETDDGYFFWYARYIGKYWTADSFSMTIGYNGSVVGFKDSTETINWESLDIDEEYIDTKIKEFADEHSITKIKGDYVCMYQGKVCVYCSYGDDYESITPISLE